MNRRLLSALCVLGLLIALSGGCGSKPDAPAQSTSGSASTGAPAKGAAGTNSTIGINPDYKGPADGGLGSKSGK